MRPSLWIGALAMVAVSAVPPPARASAALDSLVASERAFAALSVSKGVRESFLAYLAEGAVVFQPRATDGRKFWEARPATNAVLKWEPSFAGVSSDGDMGYTSGPWEFQPPPDSSGAPASPDRYLYGHFNSVWKKEKKIGWRVVADIGITHERPARGGVGSGDFMAAPALPIRTMKSSRINLADQDKKLSKDMRAMPPRDALAAHATTDLRFNTEGHMQAVGIEAAQGQLDSLGGFFVFTTESSQVARSGDLGFTYGLAERYLSAKGPPADSCVYLHVWREESGRLWKLALAVINPLRRR